MKRIIAITLVAVMMLFACSVSAFAEISPTAEPETNEPTTPGTSDGPTNDSPTSPQTGDVAVYVGIAVLFMAAAATVLAVKKVKQ